MYAQRPKIFVTCIGILQDIQERNPINVNVKLLINFKKCKHVGVIHNIGMVAPMVDFFLYPRHLCRRVYSFRFSVRMFVGSFVRSLVRSLFWNVRGIYVKVFVKVSLVVYIS